MSDPDNSGSDRITADVLVLGGIVVTMDERRTILPDGALARALPYRTGAGTPRALHRGA